MQVTRDLFTNAKNKYVSHEYSNAMDESEEGGIKIPG